VSHVKCPRCSYDLVLRNTRCVETRMMSNYWWCASCDAKKDPTSLPSAAYVPDDVKELAHRHWKVVFDTGKKIQRRVGMVATRDDHWWIVSNRD
jgi:hypothetical protein